MRAPFRFIDFAILLFAATLVASALAALLRSERGLVVEPAILGGAPATVFRAADRDPAPAVLIAHGFAGSQQLMRSFAISLARAGFVAVTYDALGHGRNPEPLSGDVTKEEGATQALLAEMAAVSDAARALPGVDGRLALLGHSMASDIVVRRAQTDPGVEATVAVSMFSQTVDGASPRTLLILVGAWENFLAQEALRVVALAHGPDGVHDTRADPVEEAVTYGRFEDGSARRAALVDGAEHVGVLFAAEGQREAVAWLRAAFETGRDAPVEARGLTLVQLFAGLALLAWPLSRLLPTVAREPLGAGLPGARILLVAIPPAALTPLILWRAPIEILPVAVADYLAAHFLVYGALTALGLWLAGGLARPEPAPESRRSWTAFALASLAFLAFFLGAVVVPIDAFFTSFSPTELRAWVIAAMLLGTAPYFISDAWLSGGDDAPAWAAPLTKLLFLLSLAAAVALDLERLFFLIIILPLVLVFFALFGLWARWCRIATGDPAVGALGSAVAFAWSLAVTFPVLAG